MPVPLALSKGKPALAGRAWLPALFCLLIAFPVAGTHAQQASPEPESLPDLFDHEKHEGLKVDCDTCHARKGQPELRNEACFVCHDGEEPIPHSVTGLFMQENTPVTAR